MDQTVSPTRSPRHSPGAQGAVCIDRLASPGCRSIVCAQPYVRMGHTLPYLLCLEGTRLLPPGELSFLWKAERATRQVEGPSSPTPAKACSKTAWAPTPASVLSASH